MIERNIYSRAVDNATTKDVSPTPKPAEFSVKKIGSQYGLVLEQHVKANQFITEYLGEVIDNNKVCHCFFLLRIN